MSRERISLLNPSPFSPSVEYPLTGGPLSLPLQPPATMLHAPLVLSAVWGSFFCFLGVKTMALPWRDIAPEFSIPPHRVASKAVISPAEVNVALLLVYLPSFSCAMPVVSRQQSKGDL
jgi:hypothetical protein